MLRGGDRGQYLGHHRFCLMSLRLVDEWILYLDVGSVWHKHWSEFMYIGQWPIFHGPVILPYILKTICRTNAIIGMFVPCDVNIYFIKCGSVTYISCSSDFVISWRLLDGLMLYWRCWFSVKQTLNSNYICRSVTYILWPCDFALYLEDYLMDKCHNWNTGSMCRKDLPDKMYVG